jgi:ribonuclease HIII
MAIMQRGSEATPPPSGRIGTDEAGKGDYFGPLVVGAVWADADMEAILLAQGVKDSKRTTDGVCRKLAHEIERLCPHEIVRIFPAKYNELIGQMNNLNRLLGWAHARAIESLLTKLEKEAQSGAAPRARGRITVISDQFGDEGYIAGALMKRGKTVALIQQHRAESETVVAAASILARVGFLDGLKRLSEDCGIALPKGATIVVPVGKQVVAKGGQALLATVAKMHFKTTKQVLGK